MELLNKKVLVVGAGRSGLAAVKKLKKLGAKVLLTDRQERKSLSGIDEIDLLEEELIVGRVPEWKEVQADLIVLSPGVSPKLSFIQEAQLLGVPVSLLYAIILR